MRILRNLLIIVGVAAALGGCANMQKAWDTITGARVSPQAIYIAANTADSAEVVATSYLKTCHKAASSFAACSKDIEGKVIGAVRSVRQARNDLKAFLKAHPDALGSAGLFDALKQAQATLTSIINDYNLAAVKS